MSNHLDPIDREAADADEVVLLTSEARRAVQAAQVGIIDMRHGITRALRVLSDVEGGHRRPVAGEGWPGRGSVEETVRDLSHRCDDALTAGRGVEHQVVQARAALQAARVMIEGMEPTSAQGVADQVGLRALTMRLDKELGEARPLLGDAVTSLARAGVLARDAETARDGHHNEIPVDGWQQMLSGASRGNTQLQEALSHVSAGTNQVAGHAAGVAAAARYRSMTEQRTPGAHPTGHIPAISR